MKLRSLYYQFYRGRNYYCNICGHGLRRFVPIPGGDKLCARCGSLARNRRLFHELQKTFLGGSITILDFSPSRNLYRVLKNNRKITYISTDFSGEFLADHHYDITGIDLPDSCVDLIICYHILEHIDNDALAMIEMHRVLRPGGTCMIQTPFKDGDIYENPLIRTPDERLTHFGQTDHVRIYSVEGLKNRLTLAGFLVEILEFNEPAKNKYGFKEKEYILLAKKSIDLT